MHSSSANKRAAFALAFLGAYLQLVEWVNLYPWNDVRDGNGQERLDLICAAVTILLVLWLWFGGRIAAGVTSLALASWAYLQAATWWIPYFEGASEDWKRVWNHWFSGTLQILPTSENR